MKVILLASGDAEAGKLSDTGKQKIKDWLGIHLPVGTPICSDLFYDGSPCALDTANIIKAGSEGITVREARGLGVHRYFGKDRFPGPSQPFETVQQLKEWELFADDRRYALIAALHSFMLLAEGLPNPASVTVVGIGDPLVIALLSPTPESTPVPEPASGLVYTVLPGTPPKIVDCTTLPRPKKTTR